MCSHNAATGFPKASDPGERKRLFSVFCDLASEVTHSYFHNLVLVTWVIGRDKPLGTILEANYPTGQFMDLFYGSYGSYGPYFWKKEKL